MWSTIFTLMTMACGSLGITVDVLKFEHYLSVKNSLDKQCRPRSDCFFHVYYSNKHFVIPALINVVLENRNRNF